MQRNLIFTGSSPSLLYGVTLALHTEPAPPGCGQAQYEGQRIWSKTRTGSERAFLTDRIGAEPRKILSVAGIIRLF